MFRYSHHAGHPVFALLILVLLAALVVIGAIALVRSWRHSPGHDAAFHGVTPTGGPTGQVGPLGPSVDPALTELRVRYARGDITYEEFAQRSAALGYPIHPGAGPGAGPSTTPPPPAAP
ncbi:MAG: hypothetical protein ACLQPH_20525 [Acidimicrobiales bacterium]